MKYIAGLCDRPIPMEASVSRSRAHLFVYNCIVLHKERFFIWYKIRISETLSVDASKVFVGNNIDLFHFKRKTFPDTNYFSYCL